MICRTCLTYFPTDNVAESIESFYLESYRHSRWLWHPQVTLTPLRDALFRVTGDLSKVSRISELRWPRITWERSSVNQKEVSSRGVKVTRRCQSSPEWRYLLTIGYPGRLVDKAVNAWPWYVGIRRLRHTGIRGGRHLRYVLLPVSPCAYLPYPDVVL